MPNAILLALAPVFFVLILGFWAGRRRMVDNHNVDSLNALVMQFALPAALFVATASAPRAEMLAQAPLFAILGGVMLVVAFGWYYLIRGVAKVSKADASLQALTIAFPNFAGVGLPIMAAVLGAAGTVPVAVALAAGSILVSPLSLILVEMDVRKGDGSVTPLKRVLKALRPALTKPIVLAPALGILVSLSGVELGPVIGACLKLLGAAAAGVALFLTGLVLSAQPFKLDWKVVAATVMADIIRPLLTAAVVFAFPVPWEIARVAILLAVVPSGFFGILFAVNYRLDSAAIGSMVTASTVFSILTLAVAIAVLFPH